MSLYNLINKLVTNKAYSSLSQNEIDSICIQYQVGCEDFQNMINTIRYHKYLEKIDIQDGVKLYSNTNKKDLNFVIEFEKILNSKKIGNILQIVQKKNFEFDLRKIGVNITAWADTQLFLQSMLLQKVYCFLIINQEKIMDHDFIDVYFDTIISICNSSLTFDDLLNKCDDILFKCIITKGSNEKSRCLDIIKNNFVDKGYCFHGFNNKFENQILENGLSGDLNCCDTIEMLKIDNIFRNYNMNGVFQQNWSYQQNPNFFTTDNFGAAYYYSVMSPVFMSRLVSNGNYMLNEDLFDRTSFIQRNVNACMNNVNILLAQYNVMSSEANYIKMYINEYLTFLFENKDNLKIAFFSRGDINRNFSNNYDKAKLMEKNLSLKQLLAISLKPSFEIDRHQNTTYDPTIINSITIPNYAKSLIKKRN